MVTYAKDELVGITELGRSLGNYLDKVTSKSLEKLAIVRRNKPEAVIIPIDEYEELKKLSEFKIDKNNCLYQLKNIKENKLEDFEEIDDIDKHIRELEVATISL
jgi:prevent-host-death family protein